MIHNVHERDLPVDPAVLGELLATVAEPAGIWPGERWHPMTMDRPLAVGARGGHGPIRYDCTGYEPGRRVEFTFTPAMALRGTHTLEVLPDLRPGTSVVRHSVAGRAVGSMRLLWPLVIRALHDALLEDLLDRAAAAVGHPPARPAVWSPWVRVCHLLLERKPRSSTAVTNTP